MSDEYAFWSAFSERLTDYLFQNDTKVLEYLSPTALAERLPAPASKAGASSQALMDLVETLLRHSPNTGSPQFLNQLYAGREIPALVGEILSAVINGAMYTYEMSPCATLIEQQLIAKMGSLAGFRQTDGTFTPGGSYANMMAMLLARDHLNDIIKQQGLSGSKPLVAFVSSDAHYSFLKAASTIGIGTENLIKIATNADGKMDCEALDHAIEEQLAMGHQPFFVCATAGTTVRGVYDDIAQVAVIARRHSLWCHVDGAYGASALLSDKHRACLDGIANVDSLTWNAHKMMGVALSCSALLLNNKDNTLTRVASCDKQGYLFHNYDDDQGYDLGVKSLLCGRRADALKLWFAWQALGDEGYARKIEHCFELAKFAESIISEDPHFTLVYPVASCNVCFQVVPDSPAQDINEFTQRLRFALVRSGAAMVNQAQKEDKLFLRLVTVNFNATQESLLTLFDTIKQLSKTL